MKSTAFGPNTRQNVLKGINHLVFGCPMTEAPERIWRVNPPTSNGHQHGLASWPQPTGDAVEYVRADIHAAVAADLALARELIALLEEAQERDEARIAAFDAKNLGTGESRHD